jgi:hypothetical protein
MPPSERDRCAAGLVLNDQASPLRSEVKRIGPSRTLIERIMMSWPEKRTVYIVHCTVF